MQIITNLLNWTNEYLLPMGAWGLFLLAIIEAIFFPIPVDVLLVIITGFRPELFLFYAVIATIGSVLGAIISYYIGYLGEVILLERLFNKKHIQKVHNYFNKYGAWAVFISGFTPLPYKLFAIAAGAFYIDKKAFFIASVCSRFLRFFLVAGVIALVSLIKINISMALLNVMSVFLVLLVAEYYVVKKLFWN